jgi:hypothetical protein
MSNAPEAPTSEPLTADGFLELLESTDEGFHLVGGALGTRGETTVVHIAGYHAPMHDFLDHDAHMRHWEASESAKVVEVFLSMPEDFRYGFDVGMEWFRLGKAFLNFQDRQVPVRLLKMGDWSVADHWVFRDTQTS